MVKAVFFDLDGTLLDTVADIQVVLNETCEHFGYPPVTAKQAQEYIGEGAWRLIERALPEDAPNKQECFEWYTARYKECANTHTRLFDGVPELLHMLKDRGVKLAVVTNKPQGATETTLAQFFPAGTFDFIAGDSGAFPCKPDPSLTRYAALTMRVSSKESVFIGDGETDVLTAKNAGMRGISVLWGYRTREQLEAAGAREFAETVEALKKILENS